MPALQTKMRTVALITQQPLTAAELEEGGAASLPKQELEPVSDQGRVFKANETAGVDWP
jgi:hypothetical protein